LNAIPFLDVYLVFSFGLPVMMKNSSLIADFGAGFQLQISCNPKSSKRPDGGKQSLSEEPNEPLAI
jgi:hypothetical protein